MTRYLLSILTLVFAFSTNAQSYSEDFESFSVGDLIAESSPDWTTWSGAVGGTEDAPVSDAQSVSGSNSVYFSSTAATGGPQDVVLPLGGHHTDGHMSISMEMFVENNKGGYFNIQALPTIGSEWALNIFMLQTGDFIATDNNGVVGSGTFNTGEWWNLELDLDMTSNSWEILMDGVSLGTFSSASNQVASIDFFPYNASANGGNDISGFYVDDLSYEYTPYTPLPLDAALYTVDVSALGLTGQNKDVSGSVINLGITELNSFDIEWSYGTASGTENVTGVNIANLATYDFAFATPITLEEGVNGLDINITNVNGSVDDDPDNNDGITNIEAVTATPGKVVVAEEATGTWCGWCPRGAVFLEYMHDTYEGFFAGVAVHNGDPMTVAEYDDGFGASSFPNLQVDRNGWVDPSNVELGFISSIQEPIDATVSVFSEYAAGQIDVTATVNATSDLEGYRLAVVLIENNVTGTGSGWPQANYYSGGTTVMGGYENLADPVPAADMVYQEVARAILGGANGTALPTVAAGSSESQSYTYMVPADQEANQMHAIGILFAPNGQIHNAGILDLAPIVGIEDVLEEQLDVNLFPNPANDFAQLSMNLEQASLVTVKVVDAIGKTVFARNYGTLSGNKIFPINTQNLANGSYVVLAEVDGVTISKKLMVNR